MILAVDDDFSITASLSLLLKQAGYHCATASSPEEAMEMVSNEEVELVLQDMNFSRETTGEEGLALLERMKARKPELPIVLITAWGSIELAVEGMKRGAADFITKPWSNEQIIQSVRTILGLAAAGGGGLSRREAERENPLEREELDRQYDMSGIVGNDAELIRLLELIGRVSRTDASVLISGLSGTGKEMVAEAIHRNSDRSAGPFVKVNLGGISTFLFESEMFGHVKGAFTDAHRDREGRFQLAAGGTIFLDEIGELDRKSQVKLLRVLQDRTFEVLGSSESRTIDVRVVSATNRDLNEAVRNGSFREDLLYRLNLISVELPPLAHRQGDIPLLATHFLQLAASHYDRLGISLSGAAQEWLMNHEWPGNVRQLKQVIERAVLLCKGSLLDVEDFRQVSDGKQSDSNRDMLPPVGSMTMNEVEKALIEKSLAHYGGNISRVAESLGLSRAALYRRLEKYGFRT